MKKRALIITLLAISMQGLSQDIDFMACRIVDVFKNKDTASAIGLFFMPDDTPYVISKKMEVEGIESIPSNSSVADADSALLTFRHKLKDAFLLLYNKPVVLGLDWNTVKCNNYSFAVQMNPADELPVGHGQIIIGSGNKVFEIALKSLIKVNGRWKILDIDIVQK